MPILHLRQPSYSHPIWRADLTSSHTTPPPLCTPHCSGVYIYDDGDLASGSQEPGAAEEVCPMPMF